MYRHRLFIVPIMVLVLALGNASVLANEDSPPTDVIHPDVASCEANFWLEIDTSLDTAVREGEELRTWFVGRELADGIVIEPYRFEHDDYSVKWRVASYWDKGRFECTPEQGTTWGHLTQELMTGRIQVGHDEFEDHEPSEVHVAGDPGAETGPTYRTMGELIDDPARDVGEIISDMVHRDASVQHVDDLAAYGVTAGYYVSETDHTIADVFWDFMSGTYTSFDRRTSIFTVRDFYPLSIELIGFPITEAYWTTVPVEGIEKDVLVQCFERRCLTYTPDNPDGWQVEMGNIGLHYYQWRYPDGHE